MIPNNLGWKPSPPDKRDYKFSTIMPSTDLIPNVIDLSSGLPQVYNQGNLGSCTAFATAGLMQSLKNKHNKHVFDPSEMYLYYFTRQLEGTTSYDSGATIRNAVKAANKFGVPQESYWKYIISKFKTKPNAKAQFFGKHYKITKYMRLLQNLYEMRNCLVQGYPFIFGYMVFESFYKIGKDGVMPFPNIKKERLFGGHAVLCVGIDMDKGVFKCRNSWGKNWGDNGYFYMPIDYMLDSEFSTDFWTAHDITYPSKPIKYRVVVKTNKKVIRKNSPKNTPKRVRI